MESFFLWTKLFLSYIPSKWNLNTNDVDCRPPLLVLILFVKVLSRPWRIAEQSLIILKAKDVIIIKNSLFRFSIRNQWHIDEMLCNFYAWELLQWRHYQTFLASLCWLWSWSTWIVIPVNCYSVTYELTYHHFPNPIESVGKSVLSFSTPSHLTRD